VTPDVELDPMTVDPLEMDISCSARACASATFPSTFRTRTPVTAKPLELVRYNLSQADRQAMRERGGDSRGQLHPDFPIKFARELALHMPAGKRPDSVHAAKDFIAQISREEWNKVSGELSKLTVDWSDTTTPDLGPVPKELEVKVETDRPDADVTAGRADDAQGDGQEQRQGAGVPRAGDDQERQFVPRQQGAHLREGQPGSGEDGDHAPRLVRSRRSKAGGPPRRSRRTLLASAASPKIRSPAATASR